jgi:hypothetical protein
MRPLLFSRSCLWLLPPSTVKKSRSAKARAGRQMGRWADRCRGVGHQLPTASAGRRPGRRRLTPRPPGSSTYRRQNRGNKARMSMKTKDKYKKSLSPTVPDQTPTARPRAAGRKVAEGSPTSRLLNLSTAKSTEQSENVYENKGQ